MDQESFRALLASGSSSSKPSQTAKPAVKQPKSKPAPGNVFKPRAVKKQSTKKQTEAERYRDRAAERRLGLANDYAQVEALAEDFERRAAEAEDKKAVEEQRKYLGGDSTHSILVKGLDFSLLEQNKARQALETSVEDDETLEQVFLEATSSLPKKRTREDIVRELKNKRSKISSPGDDDDAIAEEGENQGEEERSLEEAKLKGKFKPIGAGDKLGSGFKPIGAKEPKDGKKVKKVKKVKQVKKTKKTDSSQPSNDTSLTAAPSTHPPLTTQEETRPISTQVEPEPIDEDFDIFAGAGEYEGIDLGSSDSESEAEGNKTRNTKGKENDHEEHEEPIPELPRKANWFDNSPSPSRSRSRSPPPEPSSTHQPPIPSSSKTRSRSGSPHPPLPAADSDSEDVHAGGPVRLQPLTSSSIPSIREILAMDSEREKEEKRKARKEKNKNKKGGGGTGGDKEMKLERDLKKLKKFEEGRKAAS
ncbi:RED-like protein N-terminal region-domain-containing protein [Abortiporus biennis]|nr:RED-like protein N-terminal region-domain-containing protein [Abortiporus biennis]